MHTFWLENSQLQQSNTDWSNLHLPRFHTKQINGIEAPFDHTEKIDPPLKRIPFQFDKAIQICSLKIQA
jgi:hypothetical protein